jgi:hypothetical protein
MPEQQGQPPVIDLSFLDEDPVHVDEADWYEPLTPEQVAVLLDEAARSAGDYTRVARIQIRLGRGIKDGDYCPCPAQQRITAVQWLFVERYPEGAAPGLVADLCRLMGAGPDPGTPLTERRFTVVDGLPPQDDAELTVLMEAVRRLPRDRADTVIESTLRCALGYQRTGNPEFLTRLTRSALVTFRARRDPENQKAPDAIPPCKPTRD